jgi:hypothetical protein
MRLLELLMKHGADIYKPDAIGRTAHGLLQAHTAAITPSRPPRYLSTPPRSTPPRTAALTMAGSMAGSSFSPAGLAFAGGAIAARSALSTPGPAGRSKLEWQPRWEGRNSVRR